MNIVVHNNLESLGAALGWSCPGRILENDLDIVENETDANGRRRRDAEVLTTAGANAAGPILDIGTSHGHSAFRFASNIRGGHPVHTVNILPEQFTGNAEMITHLLSREQIGTFYRAAGLPPGAVIQHYADTLRWNPPAEVNNLALAFVDGAHDAHAVFSDSCLAWSRLAKGGLLMWHDYNPEASERFYWIKASMTGVAEFLRAINHENTTIHHLRHSWIGLMVKEDVEDPTSMAVVAALTARLEPKAPILIVGESGIHLAQLIRRAGFTRISLLTSYPALVKNPFGISAFVDDAFAPRRLGKRTFMALLFADKVIYEKAAPAYLARLAPGALVFAPDALLPPGPYMGSSQKTGNKAR